MDGSPPSNLTPAARRAYEALLEAPTSPVWTHPREDLLTPADRQAVAEFGATLVAAPPHWPAGGEPAWLAAWLDDVWPRVPLLAARGPRPPQLTDVAPIGREVLEQDPTQVVPFDAPLEELIAYSTSGTAGVLTTVPSHPVTTASYIPLILHAARPVAVPTLRPDVLDWVTITSQAVGGFIVPSYSSVTGTLTAQVSLRAHGWSGDASPSGFLEEHDPAVITGDPFAWEELLRLAPEIRPQLLVSTATTLTAGLRTALHDAFDAPVVDIWSLTETGPIAACTAAGQPHRLLQPRLFVECLRADGSRAIPGERGELVVTGGINPMLPLVRYRTGDHGALSWPAGARSPVIEGFEGRAPVVLRGSGGDRVNSHSVTVALRPLRVGRFAVHQHADDRVTVAVDDPTADDAARIPELLAEVLGGEVPVDVIAAEAPDKLVPYQVDPPA